MTAFLVIIMWNTISKEKKLQHQKKAYSPRLGLSGDSVGAEKREDESNYRGKIDTVQDLTMINVKGTQSICKVLYP